MAHHVGVEVGSGLAGLPAPLRGLFERIAPHADLTHPDMPEIADALVGLARDIDFLMPHVERMADTSGAVPLHVPERGPRLFLVHRREREMGAIHDHRVWVALAPITGIESHRRWRVVPGSDRERVEAFEHAVVAPAACATLVPPDDIHDHGHLAGVGRPAYVLILLGDDQFHYHRSEWDPSSARRRDLLPGDRGRWLASEPFPHPAS